MATDSELYGFLAGASVGAAKEIYDMRSKGHTASFKDFAATAAGAFIGAKIGGLVITPNSVTYSVSANFF